MNIIETLRQFKIFEYAIFDFVVSFLGIYLASSWLSKIFLKMGIYVPKNNWLYLTLPFSILVHLVVGNITPMTRDFINLQGNYLLKILIIILLFLGLKGIKRVKK